MTATPKCKESAYWKNKEKEEFGDFDHEFFYHHDLFIKFLQMYFRQCWPFASLYRGATRTLWLRDRTVQFN